MFFIFLLLINSKKVNKKCTKWAKPMNALLHNKGYYYAINKTSIFVCINNTDLKCQEKMIQKFISYPLDILMEKGARDFCDELFSKNEKNTFKSRSPMCNWCKSITQVFDHTLRQNGQDFTLNVTNHFCTDSEIFSPHFQPKCHEIIQEFWKIGSRSEERL